MKKLIVSLCMLLVAVALLGTSTYAWFSMNGKVEAQGMKVEATTAKNLVISNNDTLSNGENVTATSTITGVVKLKPSSTQTLQGSQNFFTLDGNTGIDYTSGQIQDGAKFKPATIYTTAGASTAEHDVVKHTFYIRVDGKDSEKFTNLFVENITVERAVAAQSEISKALRVGVVCGGKGYIYAPVAGATTGYKGIIAAGTNGTDDILSTTNVTLGTYGNTSTLGEVSTTYVAVDIYIWYEGQDASCTSAKAVTIEQLGITVKFAAE